MGDFKFTIEQKQQSTLFDVRPILQAGTDPFKAIMSKIDDMQAGEVLCVLNSFRPSPLIGILNDKGMKTEVESAETGEILTYISRGAKGSVSEQELVDWTQLNNFDEVKTLFEGKTKEIDVRLLEMPEPMITILNELGTLANDMCLFVHHKRVPSFLLPELQQRDYLYLTKEIEEAYVQMLILKNPAKQ